jgi:2-C-methyl-D-erythritol 4-phosphate cytidylyltransferase
MSVAGIVLAGGSGSRVQREVNKVFLPVGEREMLAYSLETMDRSALIDRIVLVIRDEDRGLAEQLLARLALATPTEVTTGGTTRHRSEREGLALLREDIDDGRIDVVVIHDGARPFMTSELLHVTIEGARRVGGAVPGMPIESPVYQRVGGAVQALPQANLRRMQTPQAFQARPLLAAYEAADRDDREGVDTAETVCRYSDVEVLVVPGDPRNIKVTFVEDIFQAEDHASVWRRGAWTD